MSHAKVFGPGRAVPLDRNAKIRIQTYARAWSVRHKRPGQHKGPITRAFLDVLQALLWQFHNSRSGICFPSYAAIAERAGCARSTVAAALKALEFAGVLTWQNRITRIRERCTDLFGRVSWRWRVIRTSNAYVFRSESENRIGTQSQEVNRIHAGLEASQKARRQGEEAPRTGGGARSIAAGAAEIHTKHHRRW